METFDSKEDTTGKKAQRKAGSILLTFGTIYFYASSLVLIGYFILVYFDPYHAFNPFPPPATAGKDNPILMPTSTPDSRSAFTLVPTATMELTPLSSSTPEQVTPTETFIPYPTPTDVILSTSQLVGTQESLTHYTVQDANPEYVRYSGGCNGVYVAGNVVDIDGNPVMLMTVKATGVIGEEQIDIEVRSGSNADYSESGWEIKLSDQMITTTGTIRVGLYPQGAFDPISDLVEIDTYNDCSRNLALVNFVQDQ